MLGNKTHLPRVDPWVELLQAGDYWYTTPHEKLHVVSVFPYLIACFSLVHIVYDIYLPILWNHSNNDSLLPLFDNYWLFSLGGLHYIVIPSKDTYKRIDTMENITQVVLSRSLSSCQTGLRHFYARWTSSVDDGDWTPDQWWWILEM